MAADRGKLKAERHEAKELRNRIQGEGRDSRNTGKSKKRYVVDEEAFYNQKDNDDDHKQPTSSPKKPPTQAYDSHPKEPNLARKLGLDDEEAEPSAKPSDKDKNKKKTKEELEKEKEIDEVRKIIENDSKLNKYIKEIDLLGVDIDDAHASSSKTGSLKPQNSKLNLTF